MALEQCTVQSLFRPRHFLTKEKNISTIKANCFSNIFLGGESRRGSYYGDDVSKKATVAMVVDSEPKSVFDMGKYKYFGGKIQII